MACYIYLATIMASPMKKLTCGKRKVKSWNPLDSGISKFTRNKYNDSALRRFKNLRKAFPTSYHDHQNFHHLKNCILWICVPRLGICSQDSAERVDPFGIRDPCHPRRILAQTFTGSLGDHYFDDCDGLYG